MLAEFYDPDDEQKLAVATADWDGSEVTITAADPDMRDASRRRSVGRRWPCPTPATNAPGATVLQPGDLQWFRAAAAIRVRAETGLAARFVAATVVGGYDPAAGYRPFERAGRAARRARRRLTLVGEPGLAASQNP